MKIISTPRAILLEAFDNQPATYDADITYSKVIQPFLENKIRILDTAFAIENNIDMIIAHYFFGTNDLKTKDKSEKFKTLVLTSDWCTFASKRKLIFQIINEQNLLKGSEKNDYESYLQKTMSYRNAFTHGTMSTNGEIVKLKYYEGGPKIKTIDDNYLTEIEQNLKATFDLTMKVAFQIGAIIQHDLKNNAL